MHLLFILNSFCTQIKQWCNLNLFYLDIKMLALALSLEKARFFLLNCLSLVQVNWWLSISLFLAPVLLVYFNQYQFWLLYLCTVLSMNFPTLFFFKILWLFYIHFSLVWILESAFSIKFQSLTSSHSASWLLFPLFTL